MEAVRDSKGEAQAQPTLLEQVFVGLQGRGEAIAEGWCRAIADICHIPFPDQELRDRLASLTAQAISLFVSECFDHSVAERIGADLAALHCLRPEILGRSQGIFVREFAIGLSLEQVAAMQPRLAALLEGVATGFVRQADEMALAAQEDVHTAVVAELRSRETALREARDQLEAKVAQRTAELSRANEELRSEVAERQRVAEALQKDAAERQRVEGALRESEEKYRGLVESIAEILYTVDRFGVLTYVSLAVEKLLGYRPEEMIGRPVQDFVHPQDRPRATAGFQSVLDGERTQNEYRLVTKSGEIRWARTSSQLIVNGDSIVGLRGMLSDITEQKQAEMALRASEARWRSLVRDVPDVIVIVDRDGRITYLNHVPEETSWSEGEVVGAPAVRFALPEYHDTVQRAIRHVFETGEGAYTETASPGAHGAITWYATRYSPFQDAGGANAVLLLARDVTERRKVDALKDNLIRDVSHELRTPLAKMQMSLELLLEKLEAQEIDREAALKLGGRTFGNVERLLDTVEAILDLSALKAGVRASQKEKVPVDELIEELVIDMEPLAKAQGLDLVLDLPAELPGVQGERDKLFRVLTNLVDNSLKFTDEGQIAISALARGGEVEVAVSDSGHGIRDENLDKVFDRFFQEKARFHGVGVGLTICKTIVEAHGGRIWAESAGRGQGSTIRFTLPTVDG